MHRIDTEGSNGTFTDGNPAIGQQGTLIDAAWLQAVQESICKLIEYANIALVKGNNDQLRQAVQALIAASGGGGGGGSGVPASRKINTNGLITGGRALDGDVNLAVAAASSAEVVAGTRADAVVTPANLAGAFATTVGAGSYSVVLPGGLMIASGQLRALQPEGVYTVTFDKAFGDANYCVSVSGYNATGSIIRDTWPQFGPKTTTGFTYVNQWTGGSGTTNSLDGIDWFAMGKAA